MRKKNCWEVKNCGREPGGSREKELRVCPAATEQKLDKIHGGKNAGRTCWMVAGTFCGNAVQGSFAKKYIKCDQCEFYQLIVEEEGPRFLTATVLLKKMKFG